MPDRQIQHLLSGHFSAEGLVISAAGDHHDQPGAGFFGQLQIPGIICLDAFRITVERRRDGQAAQPDFILLQGLQQGFFPIGAELEFHHVGLIITCFLDDAADQICIDCLFHRIPQDGKCKKGSIHGRVLFFLIVKLIILHGCLKHKNLPSFHREGSFSGSAFIPSHGLSARRCAVPQECPDHSPDPSGQFFPIVQDQGTARKLRQILFVQADL